MAVKEFEVKPEIEPSMAICALNDGLCRFTQLGRFNFFGVTAFKLFLLDITSAAGH